MISSTAKVKDKTRFCRFKHLVFTQVAVDVAGLTIITGLDSHPGTLLLTHSHSYTLSLT